MRATHFLCCGDRERVNVCTTRRRRVEGDCYGKCPTRGEDTHLEDICLLTLLIHLRIDTILQ